MINLEITYLPPQLEIFFDTNQDWKFKIVPKGRRLGTTKGGANACIEYCLEDISPILWVDTINGNIDRYFERYFKPVLKQLPVNRWKWNQQKRELRIYDSLIDFRSADSPEAIEGFGYKVIFLNEAGIILKNDYLYSNAILPMLLDFPDSKLIAAGVPKGKYKKDGSKHKFYELYEKALSGEKGYALQTYTTYDNPLISRDDIELLCMSMTQQEIRQEIMGEFVEFTGTNPFATQFDEMKHVSPLAVKDNKKQLLISIDFNLNPFCVIFAHYWQDQLGFHLHIFEEAEILSGSVPAMIDVIRLRHSASIPNCILTGDNMGKRGDISQRDNASYYIQIQRGLGLKESQIITPGNPTHENSRADCNYVLYHSAKENPEFDFKINPNCKGLIRDLKIVQCDAYGKIIKTNRKKIAQLSDFADCYRYLKNTFLFDWIHRHQKGVYKRK